MKLLVGLLVAQWQLPATKNWVAVGLLVTGLLVGLWMSIYPTLIMNGLFHSPITRAQEREHLLGYALTVLMWGCALVLPKHKYKIVPILGYLILIFGTFLFFGFIADVVTEK